MAKKKSGKRGQNEGSIYLGKDGRWRAVVPARYSADGKRRTLVGSARDGNTREDLARRLAVALAGERGVTMSPSRATVASFLARWLESVASRVRPRTLESYAYAVDRLIVPSIGGVKLQALEPRHVVQMMQSLTAAKRAVRSVAYARSTLRIALTDAKRWELVVRNVAEREYVDPPRIEKPEIDAYDASEVAKILAAIDSQSARLMLATIAAFGLRIGEALGLKWTEVDFDNNTLRVVRALQRQVGKGLVFVAVKTSRSRRALLMPEQLAAQLKEHRRRQLEKKMKAADVWEENGLVFSARFGNPMDPRNALRILHRATVRAGVRRLGLHKLRHSAATILLGAGVPLEVVSDILGHSNIGITKSTYAAFVVGRQQQAAGVMNDVVALPKGKS